MLESEPSPAVRRALYPPREPFSRVMLEVGDGHRLYVEQCGRPDGAPVVVLHGGPGGGCSPGMRRFFDPSRYRVILFDQRGCGKSRPHASLDDNTTWDLVADIERIREHFGIERWTVFGGSWGATLALIYAITHPDRARALILRGVFLMTLRELDWFYGGGAGQYRPEEWARFLEPIPEEERDDVIAAYHRRLTGGTASDQIGFAQRWSAWEAACATFNGGGGGPGGEYARAFARIEAQYFLHRGWLDHDGWILDNVGRLEGIEGHIVHGRYDLICPPRSSHALHAAWRGSRLNIIENAGHALSEPGVSARLLEVMDGLEV